MSEVTVSSGVRQLMVCRLETSSCLCNFPRMNPILSKLPVEEILLTSLHMQNVMSRFIMYKIQLSKKIY